MNQKSINYTLTCVFFLCMISISFSQTAHTLLMDGDAFYEQGDFAIAEEKYRKAAEDKNTLKSQFNLGNSLFRQNRFEEAVSQFEKSSQQGNSVAEKAIANYNLGNTLIKGGQLEPAIEAYKLAIQQNPNDMDARRNLYLAKLMQQEQQEQEQQQQQEQNEDQNQQDQSQNQDQQEQEQEQQQQEEQSSEEEQQQSEESQINNENENTSEEPQKLSKEDAAKLLQISENDEKKVQEKLRKVSGAKKKPEKDW